MQCKTIESYDTNGTPIYKPKKAFNTHAEAILEAKKLNINPNQIHKLIGYKCKECCKYHIGRGDTEITEKYREKLRKELDFNEPIKSVKVVRDFDLTNFKIIGKIDLTKIRY